METARLPGVLAGQEGAQRGPCPLPHGGPSSLLLLRLTRPQFPLHQQTDACVLLTHQACHAGSAFTAGTVPTVHPGGLPCAPGQADLPHPLQLSGPASVVQRLVPPSRGRSPCSAASGPGHFSWVPLPAGAHPHSNPGASHSPHSWPVLRPHVPRLPSLMGEKRCPGVGGPSSPASG